jgi:hypothetical protein
MGAESSTCSALAFSPRGIGYFCTKSESEPKLHAESHIHRERSNLIDGALHRELEYRAMRASLRRG